MLKRVMVIFVGLLLMGGCSGPTKVEHKFTRGQFVTSALNGQRGQIVKCDILAPVYKVRFSTQQGAFQANGGILHGADSINSAPFVILVMNEFELRAEDKHCP